MEDKLKWRKLKEFFLGLIGFLLGTTIHVLLGYNGYTSRTLFGVTFVVIVRALYDIYRRFRYPEIIEKEKQLEKDERNIFINYKSAYIAIYVTIFTLVIIWIVTLVLKNHSLSYFVSGGIVYMIVVMELIRYYLNKKI